jgi:GTP pyrophosphokinase
VSRDELLGDRFERALVYAARLHREQRRKGSGTAYAAHLLGVALLVLEDGGSEDEAIAALLHDAVEDQGGRARLDEIEREFGSRVALIVKGCSDTDISPKPPWRPRKEAYVQALASHDASVRRVSLADKLYNARAILLDYRSLGEELWERFDPESDQLWYYRALLSAFRETTESPLVGELHRVVTELEQVVTRGVFAANASAASQTLDRADRKGPPPETAQPEPRFALQFPIGQVREYASRYAYADDEEVIAIGLAARARGYYTRNEFIKVCRWKTPRSSSRAAQNNDQSVQDATRTALAATSSEAQRMKALRSLHGVEWPTASVFLHLAYPERYPILDQRALQALGVPRPPTYTFRFWEAYVSVCVDLASQAGVDGRTFDQALWQWSKEHGTRLY